MPTNYIHKVHPRARRLTMRVNGEGQVVITTPRYTPLRVIERFVSEHQHWITAQKQLVASKPSPETRTEVMIFGKTYQKQIKFSRQHQVGIRISQDSLILNPADSQTTKWGEKEKRQLHRFLKHTAEHYISPRANQLGKLMDINFNSITLREQKTRWGSCSSKGNLNFNWRLVHYRPEIIDYVIIHELAHRTHMNHSAKFWHLVEKYDPEYRKHRGFLKRHGMAVG